MKILVIDDERRNTLSAATLLPGQVTIADSVQTAYNLLEGDEKFDAVLTDLFMPLGSFRGSMDTRRYGRPSDNLPAGLVFALKAANKGIRTVICTDADHHSDWICSLLDLLRSSDPESQRRVAYVEARTAYLEKAYYDEEKDELVFVDDYKQRQGKPLVKDWKKAMAYSGLFPELSGSERRRRMQEGEK